MGSIIKPLHNHSFQDVVKQTETPEKFFHLTLEELCGSAMNIYKIAYEVHRDGNEEMAFIFYSQYVNIIDLLQNKLDFRIEYTEVMAMFGGMESYIYAKSIASVLKNSLLARFNERDRSLQPLSMAESKSPTKSKSLSGGMKFNERDCSLQPLSMAELKSPTKSKSPSGGMKFNERDCSLHPLFMAELKSPTKSKSLIGGMKFNERDCSLQPLSMAKSKSPTKSTSPSGGMILKSAKRPRRSSKAKLTGLRSRTEVQAMRERLLDHTIDTAHSILDDVMELKNENVPRARQRINLERMVEWLKKQKQFEEMKLEYDQMDQQIREKEAANEKRIAEKEVIEHGLREKLKREIEKMNVELIK